MIQRRFIDEPDKPKRRRYFRAVVVKLECGCEYQIVTAFYRLREKRIGAIVASAKVQGLRCPTHDEQKPVEVLRTAKT